MTQILDIGHSNYRNALGATSVTTTQFPTGWAAGDVCLAFVTQMGTNSAVTTPSGWTLLLRVERTTTHVALLYRRRLQGGDTPPTFADAGVNADWSVVTVAFRNVDATTPEDVAVVGNSGTAAASILGPDVGQTATPCARVMTFAHMATTTTVDFLTARDDATVSPHAEFGGSMGSGWSKQSGSTAGAFTDFVLSGSDQFTRRQFFDQAGATAGWICIAVALRPADPTTPPQARDLRAAVRQAALRTWGRLAGYPRDAYGIRLVVRALNPADDDGDYWGTGGGSDGPFWDLATWGGIGRWVDLTSRVRGLAWDQGADQSGGRPNVGTATVDLQNLDGALSAWASSGPYTDGVSSWFRTGTLIQIGATFSFSGIRWTPLFTGLIESVDDNSSENVDAWVTVHLVETASILATFNGTEQLPQGASENFQARFLRLLADCDWPYGSWGGQASVPQATATFQATTLAGPRLDELYLTADSAGTYVYTYPDGGLLVNVPHDTSQSSLSASFSNDPVLPELPCYDVVPYSDRSRVLNVVIGARAGGTQQLVADALSVSRYNQRIDQGNGWPRMDLICESDTTVLGIIADVLRQHANDDVGIAQISVDADMRPETLYYAFIRLQIFSDVAVRWEHPSADQLSQSCFVEAMHHQVTAPTGASGPLKWLATYRLGQLAAPP